MATKTFEELKQLAIQIRDEKTNKQNTATRIGTQMLEHLEKLEQDYYDKTTINNRTSEYNVSINHPTSGISGGNKYDLTSAIGQVPAELRHAGLKVTFLNEEGKTETWEYQGGTFTSVASWKKRDAVEIVQELGDGENSVVSQKTVTDSINNVVLELNNKTSLLETEDTYNPIFVSGGINIDGEESNFTNRIRTNNYFKGNGGNVTITCSNNAYKCRYFSYNLNKEYIGYGGEFTGEFTIKTILGNFYRFVILKTDDTDISVHEFGYVGFSMKGDGFDLENNSIIGLKKPIYKEDIKHTKTIVNNIGNYFDIIDSVFYNTVDTEWENNTYYDNYGVKKDYENWETTLVDVSGEINNTILVHTYSILGGYSGFLNNENTCLYSFQINGTSIVVVPDKAKYLFVSNRTSNPSRYISVYGKKYSNTLLSLLSNKFYGFKTEKKLLFNFKQGAILISGDESEPTSEYYGNRITTNNYFKSKGGNIVISCNNNNYKYRIVSYDDNKNFISVSNDFDGITNYNSQKGYYYRFVLLKADNTNITVEDLDDIGFYVDPTNIDDECLFTGFKNTDHKNNLLGKKVTFIGDSITAGHGSNGNPYHKIFCDIYGAIDNALGVNSTCIANNVKNGTSEDRFVNRATIANLKDSSLIIVFGGTNDFSYDSKEIGELFVISDRVQQNNIGDKVITAPTDTDSFAGALHELILTIRDNCPNVPIVFISPLLRGRYTEGNPTSQESNSNGDLFQDFVTAINDICNFYSIPVLNLSRISQLDFTNENIAEKYSVDSLHPNEEGHRIIGNLLFRFVENNVFI